MSNKRAEAINIFTNNSGNYKKLSSQCNSGRAVSQMPTSALRHSEHAAVSPIMCSLCDSSMCVCVSICVPPVSGDGGRALERGKQE
jgi:hypothetical protein